MIPMPFAFSMYTGTPRLREVAARLGDVATPGGAVSRDEDPSLLPEFLPA